MHRMLHFLTNFTLFLIKINTKMSLLQHYQEAGRRALWSVNGTRILQVGYEDEEDPKVMEAYERVGSLVCTCVNYNPSF